MATNKLFLNSDKTHLLVITSAQQHAKHNNFGIQLNTGSETIQPSNDERLLGAQVSNNFNCNSHIVDNDKSMIKMITSRINALMKVSWSADFMTRKMIGNAIVMSRIVYLVQVYGNASEYLLKGLQIFQNKAARVVTRLPWGTETGLLLNQVKTENKPAALKLRFRDNFVYRTRQATSNGLVRCETPRTETSKKVFCVQINYYVEYSATPIKEDRNTGKI